MNLFLVPLLAFKKKESGGQTENNGGKHFSCILQEVLRLYLIPKMSTFRKKFSITEICLGDRISIRSIMVLYF